MERLKILRKEKNLLQKDIAKEINVGRSTYVKYENGDSEPSLRILVELANFFNVSTDYLLEKTNIRYEKEKPVHVDELKQPSLSPEEKILLSAFAKSTDDDRRVLWALLDKYMTPNEKEYFSQYNAEKNIS